MQAWNIGGIKAKIGELSSPVLELCDSVSLLMFHTLGLQKDGNVFA